MSVIIYSTNSPQTTKDHSEGDIVVAVSFFEIKMRLMMMTFAINEVNIHIFNGCFGIINKEWITKLNNINSNSITSNDNVAHKNHNNDISTLSIPIVCSHRQHTAGCNSLVKWRYPQTICVMRSAGGDVVEHPPHCIQCHVHLQCQWDIGREQIHCSNKMTINTFLTLNHHTFLQYISRLFGILTWKVTNLT